MKKLTYVKTSWCPYCKMASRWLEDHIEKNPEFKDIEIDVIDADNDERVKKYPHELVPNFWIDNVKVFEGVPSRPIIKEILKNTLDD